MVTYLYFTGFNLLDYLSLRKYYNCYNDYFPNNQMQTSQDYLVGGMELRVIIWRKSTCNTASKCIMPLALSEHG